MKMKEAAEVARELGIPPQHATLVGSRLICGDGNDIDVLCYSEDPTVPPKHGFEPDLNIDSVDHYEGLFTSWRRGNLNLLVTGNRDYFLTEATAAHAARVFKEDEYDLSLRDHRVAFHAAVRLSVAHLNGALDASGDVSDKTHPDGAVDDLLG